MPDHPTEEPKSYSVDEMMEKLREGEREKLEKPSSELVTRPDGTQVVRVRKRKRRTEQPEPKPEPKPRRRVVMSLLILLLVLFLAVAVGLVLVLARYNSNSFRSGLEESLERATASEVVLDGMTVTPLAARAKAMSLAWGEESALQSLTLQDLSAELDPPSFLFGSWKGEEIFANSGELIVNGTAPGTRHSSREAFPVDFDRYRCQFLDVHFGTVGVGTHFKNVEMVLRKSPDGARLLLVRGGEALLPGWQTMLIDQGTAEFEPEGLRLISMRLRPKGGEGEAILQGRELLREGESASVDLSLDNFALAGLAGNGLGSLIDGTVSGTGGSLTLDGQDLQDSRMRMEFQGTAGSLDGLPFLNSLRTLLSDSEFANPRFDEISGVILRDGSGVRIQDIELETQFRMMVRGHLEVDSEGALGGRLEVGIVDTKIITATNRKRSEIFSDPSGGYCWVTVTLSGTLKRPIDDFQTLLKKSVRDASGDRDRDEVLDERFEDLTR